MTDETPDSPEKPKLKPANQNPWYCLMTLHGEQVFHPDILGFDEELAAHNRRDWNKWAARALTDKMRAVLLAKRDGDDAPIYTEAELTPHAGPELDELVATYRNRTKGTDILGLPEFKIGITFDRTHFNRAVDLSGFVFPSRIILTDAVFSGIASLKGVTFFDFAILYHTKFSRDVDLQCATIKDNANFSGATFEADANFSGATFDGEANFSGASFTRTATFQGITFSGDAYFAGTMFSRTAKLKGATFGRRTDFSNAVFKRSISFANATFKTFPPNCHEATLHSDTDWVGATWPDPPDNLEQAKAHVRYYQRLKQVMETLKKHEDELDFFAREMRAQRVVDRLTGHPGKAALNWAYEKASDYGRSVGRPFLALAAMIIGFGLLYDVIPLASGGDLLPRQALGLSIANTVGFISIAKDATGIKPESLSALASSLSVLQAGVATILLFLAGLGLRNRFRMK